MGKLPRHCCHQSQRGYVDAVQKRAGNGRATQPGHERTADRDEEKCGKKYAERCDSSAGWARQKLADERRRGENRSWRELPDGDGVEQLAFGQPLPTINQVCPQKGQQHVSAAEENRPDLDEE